MIAFQAETLFLGLYAMMRLSAFMLVFPFGMHQVPRTVKGLLALGGAAWIATSLEPTTIVPPLSLQGMLILGDQFLMGLAMAFVFRLFQEAFSLAGHLFSMQTGLGFSSVVDPQNGLGNTSIGQFYTMTLNFMFFAMQAHVHVFHLLMQSFEAMPIQATFFSDDVMGSLIAWSPQLFQTACQVALPAVTLLVFVNISFGILTRLAPQVNIFTLGFPVSLSLGILLMPLVIQQSLPAFESYLESCMFFFESLSQGGLSS